MDANAPDDNGSSTDRLRRGPAKRLGVEAPALQEHTRPRRILWLGELACHDPFLVGGKAASLSRLAARYPVPLGFALTTSDFDLASRADPSVDRDTASVLPVELRAEVAAAYRLLMDWCGMDAPA